MPSRISASSLVATRLLGSSATMRRISASAARRFPLRLADFVQHRQRARPIGGEFEHVEAQPFGGFVGALAMRLDGALDQRHEVADRLGRRQGAELHAAAADRAQAAAAFAERRDGGCNWSVHRSGMVLACPRALIQGIGGDVVDGVELAKDCSSNAPATLCQPLSRRRTMRRLLIAAASRSSRCAPPGRGVVADPAANAASGRRRTHRARQGQRHQPVLRRHRPWLAGCPAAWRPRQLGLLGRAGEGAGPASHRDPDGQPRATAAARAMRGPTATT